MSRPSSASAAYGLTPGAGVVTSFDRYNGTISTRPPTAMTTTIQMPSQWTLRSTVS